MPVKFLVDPAGIDIETRLLDRKQVLEYLQQRHEMLMIDAVMEHDPEEKTAPGESLAQQQNVEPEIQAEPVVQGAATAASGPELDKEPDHPDSAPPQAADKSPGKSTRALSGGENLRVHVSLLDSLMNLAGELVLGRNQLLQAISLKDERTIETAAQRLDLITSELQETIMLTRMQPVGNIFNKFSRVVRDLAGMLGKVDVSGSYYRWEQTLTKADILRNLQKYHQLAWSRLDNIRIGERGPSARIRFVVLEGLDDQGQPAEQTVRSEYGIRRLFSDSFLYSSAFEILSAIKPPILPLAPATATLIRCMISFSPLNLKNERRAGKKKGGRGEKREE